MRIVLEANAMIKRHLPLLFFFGYIGLSGQSELSYLKANAIPINDPEQLNERIYEELSPFQIIMFGEMHGTNESAPFVNGLAKLFSEKGDSLSIGFEIPSDQMTQFLLMHTDSSIYASDFFHRPISVSGKESIPWAKLISSLNENPKVEIFFFDVDQIEETYYQRDSLMYSKIKKQYLRSPNWKMITFGGNYHNKISEPTSMISYLIKDKELNLQSKICSLNFEYLEGYARANFGHGLEVKLLGRPESIYDTMISYDHYFFLYPPSSRHDYTGFYYSRYITAAEMTKHL